MLYNITYYFPKIIRWSESSHLKSCSVNKLNRERNIIKLFIEFSAKSHRSYFSIFISVEKSGLAIFVKCQVE